MGCLTMEEESGRISVVSYPWGMELSIDCEGRYYKSVDYKDWWDRRPFDVRMLAAAEELRSKARARLDGISLAVQWERRLNECIDILPKNRL